MGLPTQWSAVEPNGLLGNDAEEKWLISTEDCSTSHKIFFILGKKKGMAKSF